MVLLGVLGCASADNELTTAPQADEGSVRGLRDRAVIIVDSHVRDAKTIATWKSYFEDERAIVPGSVRVWRANKRTGVRLELAEDFVPPGGRMWVVWLASDASEFALEQAVELVSEGPHAEAVIVDHRCTDDAPSVEPGAVRWRGDIGELVVESADPPRVLHTWDRAERPVNVGLLSTGCRPDAAVRLTDALSRRRDLDHDGAYTLAEVAEAEERTWATGVDLVVEPLPARRSFVPRAIDLARVDAMQHIPAGTFSRGCMPGDDECESDEFPQRRIWLKGFAIDTHEVTWDEYAACVEDGGCPRVDPQRCYVYDPSQGFILRPLDPATIDPNAPMTCANWIDADAMCRWQGKHLPTEAQWERAARGRSHTIHVTSDAAPTCDEAVHDGCGGPRSPALPGRHNSIGVADLIGNLSEWTLDWYHETSYAHRFHVRDPVGPDVGEVKVVRGGSFYDPDTFLRVSYRYGLSPQFGYDIVGFRCAR